MNIYFKKRTCRDYSGRQQDLIDNQIALYVVLTRKCNVACPFCEYTHEESNIDLDKFERCIQKLSKICAIQSLHITGGEPTLCIDELKQIVKIYKQYSNFHTSVNTNGTNLYKLEGIKELDNIALSRHAISDEDNREIFRSNLAPTLDEINNFRDKNKIHLSCNLIKGYIDNAEKIEQYLEMAAHLDINDIGLVSLMNANQYCKDNFVDFDKINLSAIDKLKKTRWFECISETTGDITCRCENYLYRASNLHLVSMYHRYAIKSTQIADYLVFENNQLRQGFNGDIINYE